MPGNRPFSRSLVIVLSLPPAFLFLSAGLVHFLHHLVTGSAVPAWGPFLLTDAVLSLCLGLPLSLIIHRHIAPLTTWLEEVRGRIREQDPAVQGMVLP